MRIPLLAYARDRGAASLPLGRDLEILPGGTLEVTPLSVAAGDSARTWAFGLNTGAAGAGVAEDVAGFPLLIRLDSAFDFAAVRDPGQRLSASKPDGTPLALRIERWDSLARRAEIWIRMDTVRGDADSQSVMLRYHPEGGPPPPAAPVPPFDPADGFAGVWHLEGVPGDRADATGNGHWARPVRFRGEETVEGRVGEAVRLSGSSHLDVGTVDAAGPVTVSAWVLPDGVEYPAPIVQKPSATTPEMSRYAYALIQNGINLNRNLGAAFGVSDGNEYPQAESDPGHAGWSYLCGSYDGESVRLYRDGQWVGAYARRLPAGIERNALGTLIGAYTPDSVYAAFRGVIDEVRIETVARPAAWIRLAFENQKAGQTLIRPLPPR
jgi:hypothetical protein